MENKRTFLKDKSVAIRLAASEYASEFGAITSQTFARNKKAFEQGAIWCLQNYKYLKIN